MSRVGSAPVALPEGVKFSVEGSLITVSGPRGTLVKKFDNCIGFEQDSDNIKVFIKEKNKNSAALWGLSRSLLNNMVTGVLKGYEIQLEIVGVGFKAEVEKDLVILSIGHSHLTVYALPDGISVKLLKPTSLLITGNDKEIVGAVAADIRRLKKPEPYKGKGIRYLGEQVRIKAGKKK